MEEYKPTAAELPALTAGAKIAASQSQDFNDFIDRIFGVAAPVDEDSTQEDM